MIIIADGGSTKTNWCLLNDEGKKIYFNTEGYNPYFAGKEYIIDSLKKNLPQDLEFNKISEVNYYGAGVHNEEKADLLKDAMKTVFTSSKISSAPVRVSRTVLHSLQYYEASHPQHAKGGCELDGSIYREMPEKAA